MSDADTGFSITTAELAGMLGAELIGAGDVRLSNIEALDAAGPGDLSFVRSADYAKAAAASGAGALLVTRGIELPESVSVPRVIVDDADRALISILGGVRAHRFGPPPSGIHPSAVVDGRAEIHETASVGACAVIEHAVKIGAGTRIGPGTVVRFGTTIGERCDIGPNVSIGHEGFGYVVDKATGVRTHLPHVGGVRIGDDVDIGANSCVDRGKLHDTVIGNGSKIDNLVQIAHNCQIGEHVVICGQSALAGSVTIGDRTVIAGQVGVGDNVEIGADVIVMAQSGVTRNLPQKGAYFGIPAREREVVVREIVAMRRITKKWFKAGDA